MIKLRVFSIGLLALTVAACEQEEILEGERLPILEEAVSLAGDAQIPAAFIPAPVTVSDSSYSQKHTENLAFDGQFDLLWQVKVGASENRDRQYSASPVIGGGRIYVKDGEGNVLGLDPNGAKLWSLNIAFSGEKPFSASAGGMSYSDEVLYVASGQGEILALNAATGTPLWRHKTDYPVYGAPLVTDKFVMFTTNGDLGTALQRENGRIAWVVRGSTGELSNLRGATPVTDGFVAIFPFISGEIYAVLLRNGYAAWQDVIGKTQRGWSMHNLIGISDGPVIKDGRLYAANLTGSSAAFDIQSGDRIWTAKIGAMAAPLAVGNSVYMVSETAKLVRLDAETGQILWATQLPAFRKDKWRKGMVTHYGPLMLGNRLAIASSDKMIRFFDPNTGVEAGSAALSDKVVANMAYANKTVYVLTGDGMLSAYR